MARPTELTEKARKRERAHAKEVVLRKEAEMTNGELPISLSPNHPSAIRNNRINKTVERLSIPED